MKQITRGKVWWKNITKDIKHPYDTCDGCRDKAISKINPQVEVIPKDLTLIAPNEALHVDFASAAARITEDQNVSSVF